MPTLLQINSTLNKGSTGRIAEQIGQFARTQGNWDVWMAHGPRYKNSSELNSIQIESLWGERLHGLWSRLFDRHGLGSVFSTIRLVKRLERGIRPDVVHLHNLHGYYVNYPILFRYLARAGIPVVWTLHDCWSFTGHCAYFDYEGCELWKTSCHHCPQIRRYPSSWGWDRSRKNYVQKKQAFTSIKRLHIVPVSEWLGGLVKQSFLGSYPIQRIYNGVDLKAFSPQPTEELRSLLGLQGEFVLLGVATAFGARKGWADFMALAARLPGNYRIILVGVQQDKIRELPPNILGVQRTESIKELAQYYSIADVFLNPTYEDNFPTTNLEAQACGTPVVTYCTGGSPEAIASDTGVVVDKGDINGLLQVSFAICKKGKAEFSKACRGRAERYYNKDERYAEYLEVYKKLIS